jgi:hypothetical protein
MENCTKLHDLIQKEASILLPHIVPRGCARDLEQKAVTSKQKEEFAQLMENYMKSKESCSLCGKKQQQLLFSTSWITDFGASVYKLNKLEVNIETI